MQKLNVLYFAHVRDLVGIPRETLELAARCTVASALAELCRRHPGLERLLPRCRVALNGEFVEVSAAVGDGDELVLIPPVAGGSGALPRVRVGTEVLDGAAIASLKSLVSDPRHGAVALFVGDVRDHARGYAVNKLEYEAYIPMAERQLQRIIADLEADSPSIRIAVHHRVGLLDIGDTAVIVAVGSPHRKEALAACAEVIERLKRDVPIWKRETGPDGAVWIDDRP